MMKRSHYIVFFVLCATILSFSSCHSDKATPAGQSDEIVDDSLWTDSLDILSQEVVMPSAADEFFDDFIYNYAGNRSVQLSRTKFPLPYYNKEKQQNLPQRGWKTEHFFMRQGYYTLIFNHRKQMEQSKDTALTHVTIERIDYKQGVVRSFVFDREDGLWYLTSIRDEALDSHEDADFLNFYNRFSCDEAFQLAHMNSEVNYSAPDPDDDFSSIQGIITPEQWPEFKPDFIPNGVIYDIQYGNTQTDSDYRIFIVRGIANGSENQYVFSRKSGEWKLAKFAC